jgi:hypothetical protein
MADACDITHDTTFRQTVEKLNDDQVASINALRFGFGASLNYLSDTHDLQVTIPESFILRLNDQEEARRLDLRTNKAIIDHESAYKLYDDSAPLLSIALSFPMPPSEQQTL